MATFESVWRRVLTYAPTADALLVRNWVQDAYTGLARRHPWTFLRKELDLVIEASRTFTATLTAGSTTVTSAALFVAGDLGRQIRLDGGWPLYTITAFGSTSSITLDRAYRGTDGVQTVRVLDAYVTPPLDFAAFRSVVDHTQNRRVFWSLSELELAKLDPRRTSVGFPRQLVARTLSPVATEVGRLHYEYWPYSHDAVTLHGLYRAHPATLVDTDELPGLLQHHGDLLEMFARVEAARFPGTKDHPNPYYNLALARELAAEAAQLEVDLQLRDDDLSLESWDPDPLSQQGGVLSGRTDELERASDVSAHDWDYSAY